MNLIHLLSVELSMFSLIGISYSCDLFYMSLQRTNSCRSIITIRIRTFIWFFTSMCQYITSQRSSYLCIHIHNEDMDEWSFLNISTYHTCIYYNPKSSSHTVYKVIHHVQVFLNDLVIACPLYSISHTQWTKTVLTLYE